MNGLGILGEVVPEHIRILQVSLGVTLLSMNEMREFGGITNEENRCVVEDPIEVTFLCPDFNGEATGITSSVCRAILASNSGETDGGANLLADLLEERLRGDIAQVVGDLEVAMGTSSFGVDLVQMSISSLAISAKSQPTTRSGIRSRSK